MTLLSKDMILQVQDIITEDVPVPEWGGTVRMKTMTGAERNAWGASLAGADGQPDMTRYVAALVVACAVDEHGAPLFTPADIPALAAKSGAALGRLQPVAERLNALGAGSVEAAKGN